VICNTERLTPEIRTRFQDVVSGSAYAIGGILQAVSQFIFIFAPSNAIIQYDEGRELFHSILHDTPRDYSYDNTYNEPETSRFMR
jgi:FtsZ-interacting cell division protein YlmF